MKTLIAKHYDALLSEGNDPVHDPEPLKVYMDKWDGQDFIDKMKLDKTKAVLEIGVGTGRVAVRVAPFCERFVGVDISENALAVAKENQKRLGLDASFVQSDLFEQITGKYDIIVSNPPYIRSDVIPTLMEEVRLHEPVLALDGTEDGLFFYRKIVKESTDYLNGGGWLFFEIGYDQGEAVKKLMEENGFKNVKVVKDYAGLDRVVLGNIQ